MTTKYKTFEISKQESSQGLILVTVMIVIVAGIIFYNYRNQEMIDFNENNVKQEAEDSNMVEEPAVNLETQAEALDYVKRQIVEDYEIINGQKRLGPFANCDQDTIILSESSDGNWDVICTWYDSDLIQVSVMSQAGQVIERPVFIGAEDN